VGRRSIPPRIVAVVMVIGRVRGQTGSSRPLSKWPRRPGSLAANACSTRRRCKTRSRRWTP
jgi:hypothetical protein